MHASRTSTLWNLLALAAIIGAADFATPPPEPEKRDDEDDGEPRPDAAEQERESGMNDQRNHGPGPRLFKAGERIPQGDAERKDAPMHRGLLGYFPGALFEVAAHSLTSDRKHNPGNPTAPNWSRGKSTDHEDCIVRHLIDAGPRLKRDADGRWRDEQGRFCTADADVQARKYHLTAIAWRALALLQEHCEAEGATPGTSSRFPEPKPAPATLLAAVDQGAVLTGFGRGHRTLRPLPHPAQQLAVEAFRRELFYDTTASATLTRADDVQARELEPQIELGGGGE